MLGRAVAGGGQIFGNCISIFKNPLFIHDVREHVYPLHTHSHIGKVVKCLCGENRKENPNKCLQISLVCDKIQISYAKYGQETPERLSEAAADGKTKERFEVWQSSILKYGVPTSTI